MFDVPHITNEIKKRHTMTRTGQQPQRVTAVVAVLALLAAFVSIWTPAASAQDDKASSVLIMDASSSMLQPDGDGTRMDSAKKAAHELLDGLPIPPPWV